MKIVIDTPIEFRYIPPAPNRRTAKGDSKMATMVNRRVWFRYATAIDSGTVTQQKCDPDYLTIRRSSDKKVFQLLPHSVFLTPQEAIHDARDEAKLLNYNADKLEATLTIGKGDSKMSYLDQLIHADELAKMERERNQLREQTTDLVANERDALSEAETLRIKLAALQSENQSLRFNAREEAKRLREQNAELAAEVEALTGDYLALNLNQQRALNEACRQRNALREQNGELLAALKEEHLWNEPAHRHAMPNCRACAAIAKATEEATQ